QRKKRKIRSLEMLCTWATITPWELLFCPEPPLHLPLHPPLSHQLSIGAAITSTVTWNHYCICHCLESPSHLPSLGATIASAVACLRPPTLASAKAWKARGDRGRRKGYKKDTVS